MDRYRNDPRDGKIDLGVGVYRNSQGVTPVMLAVKAAERQLVDQQETKGYTGLAGDPAFVRAMTDLVLGEGTDPAQVAGAATVGGTGAIKSTSPDSRAATRVGSSLMGVRTISSTLPSLSVSQ